LGKPEVKDIYECTCEMTLENKIKCDDYEELKSFEIEMKKEYKHWYYNFICTYIHLDTNWIYLLEQKINNNIKQLFDQIKLKNW